MRRRTYDTDLNDAEWNKIKPLIPAEQPGGRPHSQNMQEIVNVVFHTRLGSRRKHQGCHSHRRLKGCCCLQNC